MSQAMEDYFIAREDYEVGVEDSIEQKERDVVLNMYKDKVPLNLISKYNNLSIDKIKGIINSSDFEFSKIR